ncbi:MAG: hypothetical protein ABI572_11940 [Actinomycetota bacterium]
MRNRTLITVLAVLALVASVPASAGGVVIIDPVKTSDKTEYLPAASITMSHSYFAWSQSGRNGEHVLLETDSGVGVRIDDADYSWVGGFAEGDARLIFQLANLRGNADSNVKFYDPELDKISAAPGGINTDVWQWSPTYDTDGASKLWILYGENHFATPTSPWRVRVWDEASGVRRTLAEATNRCRCIFPGTIAYPFASWSKGDPGNVFVYDLGTDVRTRLALPGDRDEHAITVTADGTAYVAQDGGACGTNPKLYRVAPDGTPTLIATLPAGTEPFTLSTLDTGAGIDLYFDRFACANSNYDVYVLRGADTVARPVRPNRIGGGSLPRSGGRAPLPPGAMPPR